MRKLQSNELGRKTISEYKNISKLNICLVLNNIRSMYNVGAIFRSADAFLIERIILTGITPQPPHREIYKTALGSTESVTWSYEKEIINALKKLNNENYVIIGIEQTDTSIELNNIKINKEKKYALVFGNEVEGISDNALKLVDYCIEIPQFGTKHSLNVSVAAGIILYEFTIRCLY